MASDAVERVLDVLAPKQDWNDGKRSAIFDWSHEETPTLEEVTELAERIVAALAQQGDGQ